MQEERRALVHMFPGNYIPRRLKLGRGPIGKYQELLLASLEIGMGAAVFAQLLDQLQAGPLEEFPA